MIHCDCEEKNIIVQGDGLFIATEIFCPKHGYSNTCYRCDTNNFSTEICQKHKASLKGAGRALLDLVYDNDKATKAPTEEEWQIMHRCIQWYQKYLQQKEPYATETIEAFDHVMTSFPAKLIDLLELDE